MLTLERLNKVLAQLGIGSRRAADAFIEGGRVMINGKTAKLGDKVSPSDLITFDGKVLKRAEKVTILLAFNKPKGVTTTKSDPFAKVTVMNYLPSHYQSLHPIGRLDRDSRGLLLFTNNGDISLKLGHPRYEHEKEYLVVAQPIKRIQNEQFQCEMRKLSQKVILPEAQTKPFIVSHAQFDTKSQVASLTIILKEGKNREIRRVLQKLGYHVNDLQRVRIESIELANLKEGEYREVDPKPFL